MEKNMAMINKIIPDNKNFCVKEHNEKTNIKQLDYMNYYYLHYIIQSIIIRN